MASSPSAAFEFIEAISRLDCPRAVLSAFTTEVGRYGFLAAALGELPGPSAKALRPFFASTWSAEMAEAYVGEGYVAHDPSIETARSSILPIMWSELEARWRADGRSLNAFRFAAAHGFPEGVVIPVPGPENYRGLVALLGEEGKLGAKDRAAIHLMALYAHERLKYLLAPDLSSTAKDLPGLSPGALECIRWLAAGKSDWEMSEILGISQATVHWRIEQAKAKFGVKTRAQLAALTVHHGYIRL